MAIAATQWTYLRNFIIDMHSPALILIQPAALDEVAVGHSFNDTHSLDFCEFSLLDVRHFFKEFVNPSLLIAPVGSQ